MFVLYCTLHNYMILHTVGAYLSISPCPLSVHWTIRLPGSLQDDNIMHMLYTACVAMHQHNKC